MGNKLHKDDILPCGANSVSFHHNKKHMMRVGMLECVVCSYTYFWSVSPFWGGEGEGKRGYSCVVVCIEKRKKVAAVLTGQSVVADTPPSGCFRSGGERLSPLSTGH